MDSTWIVNWRLGTTGVVLIINRVVYMNVFLQHVLIKYTTLVLLLFRSAEFKKYCELCIRSKGKLGVSYIVKTQYREIEMS